MKKLLIFVMLLFTFSFSFARRPEISVEEENFDTEEQVLETNLYRGNRENNRNNRDNRRTFKRPQLPKGIPVNFSINLNFLRGFDTAMGFGVYVPIHIAKNAFSISPYIRPTLFMPLPLGSNSGSLATSEFSWEVGFSTRMVFSNLNPNQLAILLDIGYYQQLVKFTDFPTKWQILNNGAIIRVGASYKLGVGDILPVELVVFYQAVLFPSYSDYNGLGFMLRI